MLTGAADALTTSCWSGLYEGCSTLTSWKSYIKEAVNKNHLLCRFVLQLCDEFFRFLVLKSISLRIFPVLPVAFFSTDSSVRAFQFLLFSSFLSNPVRDHVRFL